MTVDVLVANIWMACPLIMAANSRNIDAKTGADVSALRSLQKKVEAFHATHARIPQLPDLMLIIGVGFCVTGFAHLLAEFIQPWMVEHVPRGRSLQFTQRLVLADCHCVLYGPGSVIYQGTQAGSGRPIENRQRHALHS